ncbi:MAG: efflux RND transporter periplasmic adaptor subunit [Endozoicomonas sp.]
MQTPKPVRKALAGILAVSTFLVMTGCSKTVEEEQTEVIRPVKLFEVKDSGLMNMRQFPATVRASEEAEISFRIPGELVNFPVQPAQEVQKGQVLARLDDRDIRSELSTRKAEFDLAETDFRRVKSLLDKRIVPQSDFDNANARLKSARAALQLAQDKLDDSVLTAPFTGRVAQTLVENYQYVQAQQAILVLHSSSTLDISIQVPESIVSQVRQDRVDHDYQPSVSFVGRPDQDYRVTYKEHATRVTPGTQSYEVWFSMPIPDDLTVYPGMGATLMLDLSRVTVQDTDVPHFTVPLTAVLNDDSTGKSQVWVYDENSGVVNPVEVTLGRIRQSGISVLSGLSDGARIVSAGLNRLRAGMQVKPLERERGL